MKKEFFMLFIIACVLMKPLHSSGAGTPDSTERWKVEAAWKTFLQAVAAHDMKKIKLVSVEKIRCPACVDNTEEEDKDIETFRMTEPDWYKKLYEEKVFIPVNTFCKQDYPIIFSEQFIKKLQNSTPAYRVDDLGNETLYEVLIPTAKPGELATGHEGVLHIFQFIQTNNGYKFWGLDTIP
ncbi:MAG: hypothetical protein JW832_10765 [Deltaproteobacteria bacterium]|nr:hypothetical protein [Deltaproteobacteria bacterium]